MLFRSKPAQAAAWVLALAALVSSFLPRIQPDSIQEVDTLSTLPAFTYAPPQRADVAQLVALRAYVDGLSAQGQKRAAIIASSFVFNTSIYEYTYRSMGIPEPDAPHTEIIYFSSVDKRDAFSWNVLTADYLVVADPVQTHLGEENQHLVTVLARPVLTGTGIGTAYRQLDASFALEDGVTVYVYERVRDIAEEEYQAISDVLTALYPDYADLYAVPDEIG